MAEPRFDALIHAPARLRICAMLFPADGIDFTAIQQRTELSKSALSKHLTQLQDAGYLEQQPFTRNGRSRLMLHLTSAGRDAYQGHRAALQEMLESAETL